MPNRSTDALFQLIKSLEKSEKRNFKLYVKRNSGGEDLKIVLLFDALDKMDEYDEEGLLRKNKTISNQQFNIGGTLIPLSKISDDLSLIRTDIPVIVHCQSGQRSMEAIERLQSKSTFNNLMNLSGGIAGLSPE